jgi:hypothetical protein
MRRDASLHQEFAEQDRCRNLRKEFAVHAESTRRGTGRGFTTPLFWIFYFLMVFVSRVESAEDVLEERQPRERLRTATRNHLPTDRSYRSEGPFPEGEPSFGQELGELPPEGLSPVAPELLAGAPGGLSSADLARLMRPRFDLAAEWSPASGGFSIASYDARVSVPTYPFFGPPPPFVQAGFSLTDLDTPLSYDLPGELYDVSLGASWMRKINDRWMLRLTASAAYASDGQNNSSDAWQFRGGVFGLFQQTERWQWVVGALATGRNDLPVIPAAGAVWEPRRDLRIDLLLPRPRVSWLVFEKPDRQHWMYWQAGFTGGTWAFERPSGADDVLTYREWRFVLGWESVAPKQPGQFISLGPKFGAEVGYAFGREFEFESGLPDIDPDSGVMLRAYLTY